MTDTGTAGTEPGIEMNGTAGVNRFTGVTVTNGGSATAIGVRLNSAASVVFTNTATNTIATTGAKALDAAGTNLLTSRWNDITVTDSATGAIRLSSTTGQPVLGDGAGTDLSLRTTSGSTAALDIASSNSVSVDAGGTDTISAIGGPAVDIGNSFGSTFDFETVISRNSAGDGINLDTNLSTPFTAAIGEISGAAGIAVDVDGGGVNGGVSYGGDINDGPGPLSAEITGRTGGTVTLSGDIADGADAGGGIVVSGSSGGQTTFSGATKVINTGAADAVLMTSNAPGSSLAFTGGGLDIRATSGRGLDASSNGGTIAVSGAGNSIRTITGRALNVTSTPIHDDDLTFRSIATNGAANGIVLNNTSNADGRLVVTGDGGACSSAATCSGGAIQSSAGAGVELTSVPGGAALTRMAVTGGGDDGIRATTVDDLDVADSIVTNPGNSHAVGAEERGLDYLNVSGTPQILRTTVSGSDDSNAHIHNTTGTTALTVDGSTFSGSKFNAGLRLLGEANSVMNATVVNSFFTQNADAGFSMRTDVANAAQQTLLFSNNEVSGGSSNAVSGRPQVSIDADSGSNVKATVTNNKIKSAAGAEVILNTGVAHTGTFDVKVNSNSIGDAQPGALDALADGGSAIWGSAHGDGITRMEIRNNAAQNWGGRALELSHNDGSGQADYTVTGNVFSNPDAATSEGMYVFSGVGNAAGHTSDLCVDMENNDFDGIGRNGAADLALARATGSFLTFVDFNATAINPPASPNLRDNLRAKNALSSALTLAQVGADGVTNTPSTACDLPVGTP